MWAFSENNKLGFVFLFLGIGLYGLGILFLCDRAFLLLGNIAFMGGLCFLVGVTRAFGFFIKKGKVLPAVIFFGGFFLIFLRWSFFGLAAQLVGIFMLFKSFLSNAFSFTKPLPKFGQASKKEGFLSNFVGTLTGSKSSAETV